MMEQFVDLPEGVVGFRAGGELTKVWASGEFDEASAWVVG